MNKQIKFSELALEEVISIYENLENFKAGLGERFYEELREATELIKRGSESF